MVQSSDLQTAALHPLIKCQKRRLRSPRLHRGGGAWSALSPHGTLAAMTELDPISRWAQTVNWDAWGPIFALLAVGWAIVVAGQASAEARRRDAAKVAAVFVLVQGLHHIFAGRLARGVKPDRGDATDPDAMDSFRNLRIFLESIVVTDLPTAATVDAYLRAATAVQILHACQAVHLDGRMTAEHYLEQVARAAESTGTQAERLKLEAIRVRGAPQRAWIALSEWLKSFGART